MLDYSTKYKKYTLILSNRELKEKLQERLEEEMLDQMIAEDILCQEMLNAMLDNKPSETISEPVVPYSMSLAGKISTTHLAESFEYLLNITKI